MVARVDHEHLVDANVVAEKLVGVSHRIIAEIAFLHGGEPGARGHGFGHLLGAITLLDDAAGQQTDQATLGVDHREGLKAESPLVDHGEHVAHIQLGRDGDGILDQAVDVAFDARDLMYLVLRRHVAVDQPEAAVERHGDRHARLGDRVHVGRDDRNLQTHRLRELRGKVGVLGQDLRIKRCQGDVVVGQRGRQVAAEKLVGGRVELGVGGVGNRDRLRHDCHERNNAAGAKRNAFLMRCVGRPRSFLIGPEMVDEPGDEFWLDR